MAGELSSVRVGALDGSIDKEILQAESGAIFAAGRLHFVRETTLLAQSFDPKRMELIGEPIIVAEPVARNASYGKADFTASQAGDVAYIGSVDAQVSRLGWYD